MAINITNPLVNPFVFNFTEPAANPSPDKHFEVDVSFTFSNPESVFIQLASTSTNFANTDRFGDNLAEVDFDFDPDPLPNSSPVTVSFDVPFEYYNRAGAGEHFVLKTRLTIRDNNDFGTDTIDIWVDILGRNDLPTAFNDPVTVNDTTGSFTHGGVLANDDDVDINDVFAVIGVGAATAAVPGAGTVLPPEYVAQTPGTATFTASAVKVDFNRYYQFLAPGESVTFNVPYTMSDGHGGTDTAFVACKINGTATATFVGTNASEQMLGENDTDNMFGKNGNDTIFARGGADVVDGDKGNDILVGGLGPDDLFGDKGDDIFRLLAAADSGKKGSQRDAIFDFRGKDKLDLSPVDPIAGGADDAFKWRGTKGFTGNRPEVMYDTKGSKVILFGDANADGKSDFSVQFNGLNKLDKGDLIL